MSKSMPCQVRFDDFLCGFMEIGDFEIEILNMGLTEHTGVTKLTIERTFASLQKKGKTECIGSKRDGRWVVIR